MTKPMIQIDDMPFPEKRRVTSRYGDTFARLRPGQCLKVLPEDVDKISKAFGKYLRDTGKATEYRAAARSNFDDGFARIWMLPKKPVRMADLPGRKVNLLKDDE